MNYFLYLQLPYQLGIIRQFPFSSNLQCMSTICRELGKPHMTVYTKGAPEKIATLCIPETLPPDFDALLSQFTSSGYRVIAIAYKELGKNFKFTDTHRVKRNVVGTTC